MKFNIKKFVYLVLFLIYVSGIPWGYSYLKEEFKRTHGGRWNQMDRMIGCVGTIGYPVFIPMFYVAHKVGDGLNYILDHTFDEADW